MTRVLVTGSAGMLGRLVTRQLQEAGHTARVMSRHARPASAAPTIEWAQADLATGVGMAAAVADAPVIIHAASRHARQGDMGRVATRYL